MCYTTSWMVGGGLQSSLAGHKQAMGAEKQFLIGVAGWSYEDWKGVVYPSGERNKLSFIARFLDCVEINTSFYRPLNPSLASKWLRDVSDNERFRFTAKLWSGLTHQLDEAYQRSEVPRVKAGFAPLQESGRLVAVLLQFPFYFRDSAESRDRLQRIAEDFAGFTKVLEVRDNSWAQPEALEFVRKLGLNIACLDMPLARSSFRERALVTGQVAYLRLHGRNYEAWFSKDAGRDERYDYLYSEDEMDSVVERVQKLQDLAQRVVVIWNNHFKGKAVVNALESIERLLGRRVDVPEPLLEAYPRLREICRTRGGRLFEH